jgi:hypothetical protein
MQGDAELVLVVPLIRRSAVEVGAAVTAADGKELVDLEIAHVLWCATGHDDSEDPAERWAVATYWPSWYAHADVDVIAL